MDSHVFDDQAGMSHARQASGQWDPHVLAGTIALFVTVAVRLLMYVGLGWTAVIPLFVAMMVVARRSPPVAAAWWRHGFTTFGDMAQGNTLFPRLPVISMLTVWLVVCLFHFRRRDGSLASLSSPGARRTALMLLLFFAVGMWGTIYTGAISNPLVSYYVFDILRSWLGCFVVAALGCRGLADLSVLLVALPVAFLSNLFYIPLDVWYGYLSHGIFTNSALAGGLGYGALNTNSLGQEACIAAVLLVAGMGRGGAWWFRWVLLPLVLLATVATVILTASRQALLGLGIGLVVVGFGRGLWKGTTVAVILVLSIYIVGPSAVALLPSASGIQSRLLDFGRNPESWETGSYTIRAADFRGAIDAWTCAPVGGLGFGGQGFAQAATAGPLSSDTGFALRGSHSLILGILAQTGVVGFALFLGFSLGPFLRFLRLCRHGSEEVRRLSRALRPSVAGALVCIILLQNISGGLGPGSATLLFLLGSLAGAMGAPDAHRNTQGRRRGARPSARPFCNHPHRARVTSR